jgi:SHS2 domain-containing protein
VNTSQCSFDSSGKLATESVYRWVEHTGEVELQIDAASEEAVFADALAAFAELVGGDGGDGGPDSERREVELEADDRGLLLADWLNELVYLTDAGQFVPERISELELELACGRLRAIIRGHCGDPRPLVKAASLHRLEYVREREGRWRARLVLDV